MYEFDNDLISTPILGPQDEALYPRAEEVSSEVEAVRVQKRSQLGVNAFQWLRGARTFGSFERKGFSVAVVEDVAITSAVINMWPELQGKIAGRLLSMWFNKDSFIFGGDM